MRLTTFLVVFTTYVGLTTCILVVNFTVFLWPTTFVVVFTTYVGLTTFILVVNVAVFLWLTTFVVVFTTYVGLTLDVNFTAFFVLTTCIFVNFAAHWGLTTIVVHFYNICGTCYICGNYYICGGDTCSRSEWFAKSGQ